MNKDLIKEIDAVLPQTQCGQCGFAGCEPYATAIVEGRADINQCPPGDSEGIRKIAALLGVRSKPLNTRHGLPKPVAVAYIDEATCIGCTFCIRSCPVDAIVGAAKQMHTVITDECTGCELCVAPCPMDCITMMPVQEPSGHTSTAVHIFNKKKADRARQRYQFRQQRLERKKPKHPKESAKNTPAKADRPANTNEDRKQAVVQAAIRRAAAIRAQAVKS